MEIKTWFKTFLVICLMVTNVAIEKQFEQMDNGNVKVSWDFSVSYNDSYALVDANANF